MPSKNGRKKKAKSGYLGISNVGVMFLKKKKKKIQYFFCLRERLNFSLNLWSEINFQAGFS